MIDMKRNSNESSVSPLFAKLSRNLNLLGLTDPRNQVGTQLSEVPETLSIIQFKTGIPQRVPFFNLGVHRLLPSPSQDVRAPLSLPGVSDAEVRLQKDRW